MNAFIKGKLLSELFFFEAVKPILEEDFPSLIYSAGLIGPGSDVIDCDTERSMDHDWGPRVILFLSEKDHKKHAKKISETLSKKLPPTYRGFSTHFETDGKVRVNTKGKEGDIAHKVEIGTINSFFYTYLYFNIQKKISNLDWLTFPEHKLLTIKKGKIFYDGLKLQKKLHQFNYYPQDVWMYLLASQWMRISQEESFMGRCGELGDEIGSKIIATRLLKEVMHLCFLMEKQYTPYTKWFGTYFSRLKCSKFLSPLIKKILSLNEWQEREKYFSKVYEYIAKVHNKLKITPALDTNVMPFHDRPFLVLFSERFAKNLQKEIKDKKLRELKLIGSINQFADSTDIFEGDTRIFQRIY